jgi:hypothetical protein
MVASRMLLFLFACFQKSPTPSHWTIYPWRKAVCFVLFCSCEIHWTGMLQIVFLVSLESSLYDEGCMGLVPWRWDLQCKSLWILNDFLIKLNRSWKFRRNWNVSLVLLERSWWAGFDEIYLVRFGFRMWGNIDFEVIFCHWKFK